MTCTSPIPFSKKLTSCGFAKVMDKEIPDICKMSKQIVQTNKYVLCTQPCMPMQKGRWQGAGGDRTTHHHIQQMGLLSCFSQQEQHSERKLRSQYTIVTHTQGERKRESPSEQD